eukprot:11607319-Alexandrium_andersonii.AAC.1
MSASLVGSEMCIRDRATAERAPVQVLGSSSGGAQVSGSAARAPGEANTLGAAAGQGGPARAGASPAG